MSLKDWPGQEEEVRFGIHQKCTPLLLYGGCDELMCLCNICLRMWFVLITCAAQCPGWGSKRDKQQQQASMHLLMDMPWASSSFTRPLPYISDRADWASLISPALKAASPSCAMVRLYRICVLMSMCCTLSCRWLISIMSRACRTHTSSVASTRP